MSDQFPNYLFNKVFEIIYFTCKKIKMKKVLTLFMILSVVLISCKSKAKTEAAEKDKYEKAKESLEEKERKNPTAFLKVSSSVEVRL